LTKSNYLNHTRY